VNGSLKSVSKDYDYPIWTLVDNKTDKVIAKDVPAETKLTTLRVFPNEYYAKYCTYIHQKLMICTIKIATFIVLTTKIKNAIWEIFKLKSNRSNTM
jgi:hypothetical protein